MTHPVSGGSVLLTPSSSLHSRIRRYDGLAHVSVVSFSAVSVTRNSSGGHNRDDTHTHPFNGPLSVTTRVSRYQKGKTNLDFTEVRDSEWQWHQLGHMQVCTSLHRQITMPAPQHSVFYRPDALPVAQPTASKH